MQLHAVKVGDFVIGTAEPGNLAVGEVAQVTQVYATWLSTTKVNLMLDKQNVNWEIYSNNVGREITILDAQYLNYGIVTGDRFLITSEYGENEFEVRGLTGTVVGFVTALTGGTGNWQVGTVWQFSDLLDGHTDDDGSNDDNTTDSGGGDNTGGGTDSGDGTDTNSQTWRVDTDDDVPMLTNIYARLLELDQDNDHQNLTNIWNRQADIAGQIEEIDGIGVRMAQIADLEKSLRRIELEMKEARGQYFDINGSPTGEYATLKDVVDAINNTGETNGTSSFDPSSLSTNQQDDYSKEFTDISNNIKRDLPTLELGQRPGFMDAPAEFTLKGKSVKLALLDPKNSYGSSYTAKLSNIFPSRAEIFLFIKRAILVVVFAVYYFANYKLMFASVDTLIKSNESNTVSSYSIFGINLGGAALKTVKWGIWAIFAVSIGFTTILGLAESGIDFDIESSAQVIADPNTSILDTIIAMFVVHIAGIADWAFGAVSMFLEIVPIATIVTAITTYYSNQALIYGSIFAMNRANRTAS